MLFFETTKFTGIFCVFSCTFIEKSSFFRSNSRYFSVSRINACIGRKGEKSFQRLYQLPYISFRQIGSAISHSEECISGKKHFVLWEIQTHAAGSMTGSLNNGELRMES